MPLNDSTFKDDLKTAFEQEDWDTCADKLSKAIDDYVKSGTVTTVVTGGIITLSYPPWTSVYTGAGIGTINDTQKDTLKSEIKTAFQQTDWDPVAQAITDAIDSFMKSAKADMTDLPPQASNDTTTIITTAGLSDLTSGIKDAFEKGSSWKVDDWKTSTGYAINDMVMNNDSQFKCLTEHTSGLTFDTTKWESTSTTNFIALFQEAVKNFIKACVVNTTDSGTSVAPPGPMNGASGIGAIT
jgi:hypothetical protein